MSLAMPLSLKEGLLGVHRGVAFWTGQASDLRKLRLGKCCTRLVVLGTGRVLGIGQVHNASLAGAALQPEAGRGDRRTSSHEKNMLSMPLPALENETIPLVCSVRTIGEGGQDWALGRRRLCSRHTAADVQPWP
jgi:hypothetical protein